MCHNCCCISVTIFTPHQNYFRLILYCTVMYNTVLYYAVLYSRTSRTVFLHVCVCHNCCCPSITIFTPHQNPNLRIVESISETFTKCVHPCMHLCVGGLLINTAVYCSVLDRTVLTQFIFHYIFPLNCPYFFAPHHTILYFTAL